MTTNIAFGEWLQYELDKAKLKSIDLAKASGIDKAIISRALSGERMPRPESLSAIARALKIPREEIYRAAGLLPSISEKRSLTGELTYLANMLSDEELQEVIDYARHRLEKQEGKKQTSRRETPARAWSIRICKLHMQKAAQWKDYDRSIAHQRVAGRYVEIVRQRT